MVAYIPELPVFVTVSWLVYFFHMQHNLFTFSMVIFIKLWLVWNGAALIWGLAIIKGNTVILYTKQCPRLTFLNLFIYFLRHLFFDFES